MVGTHCDCVSARGDSCPGKVYRVRHTIDRSRVVASIYPSIQSRLCYCFAFDQNRSIDLRMVVHLQLFGCIYSRELFLITQRGLDFRITMKEWKNNNSM